MKRWSSLCSAVGLLFVFSLMENGVTLMEMGLYSTISPEKSDLIYCMLKNCPADSAKPHYGCNNTGNWSAACGKEPRLISMTKRIRNYLVSRHNTFRDTVANGNNVKLPPAGRMCKLRWDPDLADVAKLLVRRCDLRPTNSCISTMKFPAPGFNSVFNKFKKKQNAYRIVRSQLNLWYDQYKFITPLTILNGSSLNNAEVGHFLRMMVGPNQRLGCAMAESEKDGWNYQWLTCLYGCSPKKDHMPYEVSGFPAHHCTTGVDYKFHHLCSDREVVDACSLSPYFPYIYPNDTASKIRAFAQTNSYHPGVGHPGPRPRSIARDGYIPIICLLLPYLSKCLKFKNFK